MSEEKNSFIKRYGINFTEAEYVVNPAIGREKELKELQLVLLTPDKSVILTGKPGIGKTAIVEGLAYQIQRGEVPDVLKGYTIIKVDTQSLIGTDGSSGDSRVQVLINEIMEKEKYILFIDEIHTLINATSDSALDFANMFKTGLGRGDVKVIGATTTAEYERYILRDKAFTRRFQRIDVAEPDKDLTTKIVLGVIPRIEHQTGIKMEYSIFIKEKIARFLVELTTEYNRVYETAGRYPDVPITLMSSAFSEALFNNKSVVTIADVRRAIENSKAIYPDVIKKNLIVFDKEFKSIIENEDRLKVGLKGPEKTMYKEQNETAQVSNSQSVISQNSNNQIKQAPIDKQNMDIEQIKEMQNVTYQNQEENITNTNNERKIKQEGAIDTISELNAFYDSILNTDNAENN